ncbi:CvpA family protein [Acetobacteraceae bacterium]|nr:CvpA family protein [Acetobacteraceae bacterium]
MSSDMINAFFGHPLSALETAGLLLLFASIAWGFIRGISKELFGLTSWVGAALITCREYEIFVPWLATHISAGFLTSWISGAAVFFISLFTFNFIGRWIAPAIRGFLSPPVDALLGAAFGGVRGWLVLVVLYFVAIRTIPVLIQQYIPTDGPFVEGLNYSVQILDKFNPDLEKIRKQTGLAQELWEVNQSARTLLPSLSASKSTPLTHSAQTPEDEIPPDDDGAEEWAE